jgi:hypothetical protein
MNLGRVGVRVAIEASVDVIAIDVVERIHPQFAPLDIEPSALGVAEPVSEADPQFRWGDDAGSPPLDAGGERVPVLALIASVLDREVAVRVVREPRAPEIAPDRSVRVFGGGVAGFDRAFDHQIAGERDALPVDERRRSCRTLVGERPEDEEGGERPIAIDESDHEEERDRYEDDRRGNGGYLRGCAKSVF